MEDSAAILECSLSPSTINVRPVSRRQADWRGTARLASSMPSQPRGWPTSNLRLQEIRPGKWRSSRTKSRPQFGSRLGRPHRDSYCRADGHRAGGAGASCYTYCHSRRVLIGWLWLGHCPRWKRMLQDHLQEGLLAAACSGLSAAKCIPGMRSMAGRLKCAVPSRLRALTEAGA